MSINVYSVKCACVDCIIFSVVSLLKHILLVPGLDGGLWSCRFWLSTSCPSSVNPAAPRLLTLHTGGPVTCCRLGCTCRRARMQHFLNRVAKLAQLLGLFSTSGASLQCVARSSASPWRAFQVCLWEACEWRAVRFKTPTWKHVSAQKKPSAADPTTESTKNRCKRQDKQISSCWMLMGLNSDRSSYHPSPQSQSFKQILFWLTYCSVCWGWWFDFKVGSGCKHTNVLFTFLWREITITTKTTTQTHISFIWSFLYSHVRNARGKEDCPTFPQFWNTFENRHVCLSEQFSTFDLEAGGR